LLTLKEVDKSFVVSPSSSQTVVNKGGTGWIYASATTWHLPCSVLRERKAPNMPAFGVLLAAALLGERPPE
jgi:hypothetical protein